ncbi:flagellar basal body rod protein FlgB [Virgibacillus dokdonensis]|uniref:Flagellar basal body rod protein FlgB n=2 Tax=Virgibacillus TaxID=84406 RepID=A0A1M5N8N3_9BACI|nr:MULTISPECIES: flagellar basal body rod protein FlgB [Virgibacillus]RFA37702.1 flagellar basal body rod protein FlgB [Virgibacillus dokdonensis]SHG85966.1 flagellar basal-body rod protein FlgB [Virgibacillus chiguensis]
MSLFNGTIQALEHSLGYSSAKNRAISSNLANLDTPNYKAKDVTFKNYLAHELSQPIQAKTTNSRHIGFQGDTQPAGYKTFINQATSYQHNGNNVDVDKEMADLAENQIYYQALVDRISGKFGSLQTALKGGR